jgi:hypothetical protein
MLTEEDIKKFQEIYRKKFGKDISKKHAYEQGIRVINLVKIMINGSSNKNENKIIMLKDQE